MIQKAGNPPVNLTPRRVACERHLEPFRAEWPKGYTLFVLYLFQRVVALPAMLDATGGEVERITAELDKRPMCCWLTDDELDDLTLKALAGEGP